MTKAIFACLALLQGVALGACEHDCVLRWEPATDPNGPVVGYHVYVVETNEVCRETVEPELDIRGTDCDRDGPYQLAVKAIDEQGEPSMNLSNPVWFNRACLKHTGETIDHGAWIERVGCEEACCAGCVRELPERYEECTDAPQESR